jgi:hypothetical protein
VREVTPKKYFGVKYPVHEYRISEKIRSGGSQSAHLMQNHAPDLWQFASGTCSGLDPKNENDTH